MRALSCLATSVVALAVTGCASTPAPRALDAAGIAAVRDQTVAVTTRPKPDFAAMTPGAAPFAIVGAVAALVSGNKIIADNHVADPADAIATALADALHATQGSRTVAGPVPVETTDAARIAAQAKDRARYVLDVETRNWSLTYFSTDWTHYQVPYRAIARLIDTGTGGILAESTCSLRLESSAGTPTYDELLADGAARLKATLAAAGATCAAQFKRDMLAMRDAQPEPAVLAAAAPAAAPAVAWTGVMACGARRDSGPNAAAYEARFAMEVQGQAVHAHRRTAEVEETLAGSIDHDRLDLHGSGNRIADPGRKWRLEVGGAFAPDATTYVGTGSMRVGGQAVRACELRMTRA